MKKISIILTTCLFFFNIFASDAKFRTFVLDFEDRTRSNSAKTLSEATEYLKFYLENSESFKILKDEKLNSSLKKCKDKVCKLNIAKKGGANIIVQPYITVGKRFSVNADITNVTNNFSISAKVNWNGGHDSLESTTEKLVQAIISKYSFTSDFKADLAAAAKINRSFEADDADCLNARSQKEASGWEKYLKKHPEGNCAEDANNLI